MDDLEARYREARSAFQRAYERFEHQEDGKIKRKYINPQDTTVIQQSWNVYLPLRKQFLGW